MNFGTTRRTRSAQVRRIRLFFATALQCLPCPTRAPASSLSPTATLAMAAFRRGGFPENAPGPATRLSVSVRAPATSHEVQWSKIEAWLQSAGKPNEQAIKGRLRELLGVEDDGFAIIIVVSARLKQRAAKSNCLCFPLPRRSRR